MKAMGLYDNDGYVKLDIVYGWNDLLELGSFVCTNQTVPLETLFQDLLEHENTFNKNDVCRYGATLTLMLDKKRDNVTLKKIAYRFAKKYNNLPFYAYSKKIGDGYYLVLYFCERHYVPEGKVWSVLATSDRYQSAETGKICKKDDPKAQLIYKKGDPTKKTIFAKFSCKETFFKYANKKEFKFHMEKIKMLTINLLKEFCNADIPEEISVKKFNLVEIDPRCRVSAAAWNKNIRDIEGLIAQAMNGMRLTKTYTKENIVRLQNLRNQFVKLLDDRCFKYGRFHIEINFKKHYSKILEDCYLFVEKFKNALNVTMQQILTI